MRDDKG